MESKIWEKIISIPKWINTNYELYEHTWDVLAAVVALGVFSFKTYRYVKGKREQHRVFKGFSDQEIQESKSCYITPRAEIVSSQPDECKKEVKLVAYLIDKMFPKSTRQRYYLILGDAGMGKTSLLINLVIASTKKAWWHDYKVAMFPLKRADVLQKIEEIKQNGDPSKTILLLDALDEDEAAKTDINKRLQEIEKLTVDFRKVMITSRLQFFESDKNIRLKATDQYSTHGSGFHRYVKIYLYPFNQKEIIRFLRKKFNPFNVFRPLNLAKLVIAHELTTQARDITSKPLLLSYIPDLLPQRKIFLLSLAIICYNQFKDTGKKPLKYFVRDCQRYMKANFDQTPCASLTEMYKAIISRWVDRESSHVLEENERYRTKLYALATYIAKLIYYQSKGNDQLVATRDKAFERAGKLGIDLSKIEMASRSLLSRDFEGNITFDHKSILEFFLAVAALCDEDLMCNMHSEKGWDNYRIFLNELAAKKDLIPFFERNRKHLQIQFRDEYVFNQQTQPWTVEALNHILSFKIFGLIEHFSYTKFLPLFQLEVKAYVHILDHLVFTRWYNYTRDISHLVNTLFQNRIEGNMTLDIMLDVLKHYKLYPLALQLAEHRLQQGGNQREYLQSTILEICAKGKLEEAYLKYAKEQFLANYTEHHLQTYFSGLSRNGYHQQLLEVYEAYHHKFPYNQVNELKVAIALSELGKHEQALGKCHKIYKDHPNHYYTFYRLCEMYFAMDKIEKGMEILKEGYLSGRFEEKKELVLYYATKLIETDQKDQALKILKQYLAQTDDPDHQTEILAKLISHDNDYAYPKLKTLVTQENPDHYLLNVMGRSCYLKVDTEDLSYHLKAYATLINHADHIDKRIYTKTYLWNIIRTYMDLHKPRKALKYTALFLQAPYLDSRDIEYAASVCEKNKLFDKACLLYFRLYALESKYFHHYKAVQNGLRARNGKHVFRIYKSFEDFKEDEQNSYYLKAYKLLCDYFLKTYEGYEIENGKLKVGKELWEKHILTQHAKYYD